MTDKEAIDNLKSYIEELIEDYGYHKDIVEFRDSIEHLENEIKKKNERITELEKIEEAHRELNGQLRKELQLKEKLIDEMIIALANNHCSIEDIVAEQICDDRCIGNNNWTCKKCIKEYFTKKVGEE